MRLSPNTVPMLHIIHDKLVFNLHSVVVIHDSVPTLFLNLDPTVSFVRIIGWHKNIERSHK